MLGFKKKPKEYEKMTEEALVRLAAGGDTEAFNRLLELHETMLYRYLLLSTHNEADAADLSQEAFLKAWRTLPSFRGDCRFATWLCRIARNCFLDSARAQARRAHLSLTKDDPDDGLYDVPDFSEEVNPDAAAIREEAAEAVRRAIAALPPEQQEIVRLRDLEGLSYAEIAEALGLEMGTVKSRLSRAREALKKALTEWNFL